MPARTSKYLAIYLNDHLAGSMVGIELAKRAAGENQGSELGRFLSGLAEEIEADRAALREIMSELGVGEDRPKLVVAWATEKVGRLKLNGELLRYSPLSPLVELEGLSLGIEGKRLLWVALTETEAERIGAERLRELIGRAESQRAGVERHRVAVARAAFAAS
jgi:DUF971 family protein